MRQVTLYTKPGCGLCQEAKGTLRWLARRYPHTLQEVDITQDPDLFARYRLIIPVVKIGEAHFQAPLDEEAIAEALASAA